VCVLFHLLKQSFFLIKQFPLAVFVDIRDRNDDRVYVKKYTFYKKLLLAFVCSLNYSFVCLVISK
jgi:hypothetical protein